MAISILDSTGPLIKLLISLMRILITSYLSDMGVSMLSRHSSRMTISSLRMDSLSMVCLAKISLNSKLRFLHTDMIILIMLMKFNVRMW